MNEALNIFLAPDAFKIAYQRILEVSACKDDVEFAEFLGVRQSSVSDARRRGCIPNDWLIPFLFKRGINPKWIINGKGPKYMRPVSLPDKAELLEILGHGTGPLSGVTTQSLLAELLCRVNVPEDQQQAV